MKKMKKQMQHKQPGPSNTKSKTQLVQTIIPNLSSWSLEDITNPQKSTSLTRAAAVQRLITDNGAPSIGGHNS